MRNIHLCTPHFMYNIDFPYTTISLDFDDFLQDQYILQPCPLIASFKIQCCIIIMGPIFSKLLILGTPEDVTSVSYRINFFEGIPGRKNVPLTYRKRRPLVGNKIVHHSDVVGASPVGTAPTASSFLTKHLASKDWVKTTVRRDKKHLGFGMGSLILDVWQ